MTLPTPLGPAPHGDWHSKELPRLCPLGSPRVPLGLYSHGTPSGEGGGGCAPHARPRQRGGATPRARVPRPRAGRCARGRGLTRSPVTRAAAAPGVRAPAPPSLFLLFPPPTTTPPSRCPALQPERLIHNSARPGSGSTARCGGKEAAPPGARRRGWGWGGGGARTEASGAAARRRPPPPAPRAGVRPPGAPLPRPICHSPSPRADSVRS